MPNSKSEYSFHIHNDSSIPTIGDFVKGSGSVGLGIDPSTLLLYEDELGVKNLDKVFDKIDDFEELKDFESIRVAVLNKTASEDQIGSIPLKIGVILSLPNNLLDRDLVRLLGNQVTNYQTFNSFLASQLDRLLRDKQYIQVSNLENKSLGVTKDIYPGITVWLWSRALSSKVGIDGGIEHEDTIINITPFVQSINTSVKREGGQFSLTLPPVIGDLSEGEWKIRDGVMKGNQVSYNSDGFLHKRGTGIEEEELKRNSFYFNRVIQANDVIFIRFETLEMEAEKRLKNERNFEISKQDIQFQTYDMIGLVDNVSEITDPSNTDVSIDVTGRDLMKLFIEDGVYFYPFDYTNGGIFANETDQGRLQRYDGQLISRFQYSFKTIANGLKFIINALGNIKICSDSLFSDYQNSSLFGSFSGEGELDRRSKKFKLSQEALQKKSERTNEISKKTKKAKDLITEHRKQSGFLSNSIDSPTTVNDIFSSLQSFLEELRDTGKIKEELQKVAGWEATSFGGEAIKENILPSIFNDKNKRFFNRNAIELPNDSGVSLEEKEAAERSNEILSKSLQETLIQAENNPSNQNDDRAELEAFFKNLKVVTGDDSIPKQKSDETLVQFRDRLEQILDDFESGVGQAGFVDENTGELVTLSVPVLRTETPLSGVSATQSQIDENNETIKKFNDGKKFKKIPSNISDLKQSGRDAINLIWETIKDKKALDELPIEGSLEPLRGIWQIVKLVIDDSIKDRRIVSSDLGNEHGSLINAIRKLAQEPFVEFFGDTYGDQYYLTVRKPPFDKKGFVSFLNGQINTEPPIVTRTDVSTPRIPLPDTVLDGQGDREGFNSDLKLSPPQRDTGELLIIDIRDEDIIKDGLTYGGQAYSWYRIQPQALIAGTDQKMAFAFLKAVYFGEYADIWGSKPLDLITNYIPYVSLNEAEKKKGVGIFIEQGIRDLKFMIDSNAYLPFVRRGTLTINPDRRIKRGTFVRLKNTNEIFYVNEVSHDYAISNDSIERTTTLSLERGMVEKYIDNPDVSYFNIINTEIDESVFLDEKLGLTSFTEATIAKWRVNTDVFNFFLNKKQFAENAVFEQTTNKKKQETKEAQGESLIPNKNLFFEQL